MMRNMVAMMASDQYSWTCGGEGKKEEEEERGRRRGVRRGTEGWCRRRKLAVKVTRPEAAL